MNEYEPPYNPFWTKHTTKTATTTKPSKNVKLALTTLFLFLH